METKTDLDNIMKRPVRYWYEDGLGELVVGATFLLIGGFILVQGLVSNPVFLAAASIVGMFVIGISPFIGRYLLNRFKEKIVYPRTGYVKYTGASPLRRAVSVIVRGSLIAGVVVLVFFYNEILNWLPFIQGVFVGALLFYQASQSGLVRLYIEVWVSLLLGAGLSIAGFGSAVGSGIYFLAFGLALLAAGGVAFWRYLRANAQPVDLGSG